METEQEGINIDSINPNEEGIYLPDEVVDTETEETEVKGEEIKVEEPKTDVDEEKEKLKQGVNAERNKRKAAEKKARELEARIAALEEAAKTPEKSTLDELIENGVDETIAKSIASAIDKKQGNSKEAEKEIAQMKFENAISKKSKEDGFSDIEDYSDEIKDFVDKGLTIEQAYYAITGGTNNTKSEIERSVEAKLEKKEARKEIIGNINSSVGTTATSKKASVKATAEEIAVARAAGISIEDYLAAKRIDNAREYQEYLKGKK